ncbi:MAG: TolC family protein, partial [Candidatus Latescibacterota bacterium]
MPWQLCTVLVLLFSGWLAAAVQAQEAPLLTWNQIAAQAATGPAALAAQARVRAAQAAVSEARQYPNPELGLRRGRSSVEDGAGTDALWGIEVALPLESLLLRRHRERLATAGVEIARSEEETVRLEVLQQLRLLYVAVAHDQALAASYATSLEHLAQMVEGVKARVRQGESRAVELVRLEGEQAEAQAEAEAAAAAALANRQRLALWLNREGPPDLRVDLDLQVLPNLPSAADVRERLAEHHPLLEAARNRVQQAAAVVGVAR